MLGKIELDLNREWAQKLLRFLSNKCAFAMKTADSGSEQEPVKGFLTRLFKELGQVRPENRKPNPASAIEVSQTTPPPSEPAQDCDHNRERSDAEEEETGGTVFGYVHGLTSDYGHGHPLPGNNDPLREWIATLWEGNLKKTVGILEFEELPALGSKASVAAWTQRILENCPSASKQDALKPIDDIIEMRETYSGRDVADHLNELLRKHGNAVLICVVEDEVNVFTRSLATQFPCEFLQKCERFLHISHDTLVLWYQSVDSEPLETVAGSALYGKASGVPPSKIATGNKLKLLRNKFVRPTTQN